MIIKINGTEFKPSAMSIGIQDVSASDAGRDQSGTMHKMLITQKRKIELEWWCPSPQLTKQILSAVNSEYFSVQYTDPLTNTLVTKTMYVGSPTIKPLERKRGKWIRTVLGSTSGYGTTVMYQCSECEKMAISKYHYCPNCGARMDGEKDVD